MPIKMTKPAKGAAKKGPSNVTKGLTANKPAKAQVSAAAPRLTFPVKFMAPTDLKPYWRNNKKHSQRQIEDLGRTLKQFGFDQPIVVDENNVIIKGHGRYLAATYYNLSTVPVVVRDDLSEEQARAARIIDNKTFMMSETDRDLERQEVYDFMEDGGKGAEFFFDFVKPSKDEKQAASTHSPSASTKGDDVGGTLETCPKCSHVFMEA